ncbi:unnamed protein product [Rotaria socialis]|uniref:Uncharacterized protein n=1 Tax=Rotaria socialis TaxID=392032 RepID=A0A818B8Q7_9BILA|nr:unnamed protein product [Rotaria socialis]
MHHSYRSSYGVHRFHGTRPSVIRYPRPGLSHRHVMIRRPVFYPPGIPAKQLGFFDSILAVLAVLFCCNRNRTGGGIIGIGGGGGITSGGGGGGITQAFILPHSV